MNKKKNRLESVEPELWAKLTAASTETRCIAVLHACEFAIRTSGIQYETVADAFARLVVRDQFTPEEIDELRRIADELDDEHFALKEEDPEASAVLFNQARAASAVAYATVETDQSAAEAIYEAYSSTEEIDEFLKMVHASMDRLETFLS